MGCGASSSARVTGKKDARDVYAPAREAEVEEVAVPHGVPTGTNGAAGKLRARVYRTRSAGSLDDEVQHAAVATATPPTSGAAGSCGSSESGDMVRDVSDFVDDEVQVRGVLERMAPPPTAAGSQQTPWMTPTTSSRSADDLDVQDLGHCGSSMLSEGVLLRPLGVESQPPPAKQLRGAAAQRLPAIGIEAPQRDVNVSGSSTSNGSSSPRGSNSSDSTGGLPTPRASSRAGRWGVGAAAHANTTTTSSSGSPPPSTVRSVSFVDDPLAASGSSAAGCSVLLASPAARRRTSAGSTVVPMGSVLTTTTTTASRAAVHPLVYDRAHTLPARPLCVSGSSGAATVESAVMSAATDGVAGGGVVAQRTPPQEHAFCEGHTAAVTELRGGTSTRRGPRANTEVAGEGGVEPPPPSSTGRGCGDDLQPLVAAVSLGPCYDSPHSTIASPSPGARCRTLKSHSAGAPGAALSPITGTAVSPKGVRAGRAPRFGPSTSAATLLPAAADGLSSRHPRHAGGSLFLRTQSQGIALGGMPSSSSLISPAGSATSRASVALRRSTWRATLATSTLSFPKFQFVRGGGGGSAFELDAAMEAAAAATGRGSTASEEAL